MKNTEWMLEGNFAHRGLHNEQYPENTKAAFENAFKNSFDIEMDIQLTSDNQIVVFHDKNMKRLCGVDEILEELSYEELQEYRVMNTNERIPLLQEVLSIIPNNVRLLIEFKPTKRHKLLVSSFLELMNDFEHTYAIHSFDPRVVRDFKDMAPKVIRGFISEKFSFKKYGLVGKISGYLLFNRRIKPDFINYGIKDMPYNKLDRLKKKGMIIFAYTARTQEQLDFVRNRYDNAVFERFIPKK